MVVRAVIRELARTTAAIGVAVLLAFLLVRIGAGYGVDERELDIRLGEESQSAIRSAAVDGRSLPEAIWDFCRQAAAGDFGMSTTYNRPVAELVTERLPMTLPAVGAALFATLVLALAAALVASLRPGAGLEQTFGGASAVMLGIPGAVLALASAKLGMPLAAALVVAVLPQAYRFAWGVLGGAGGSATVVAARARGVAGCGLAFRHVLLPRLPELIGMTSLTFNLLIGASIPIEALTGTSGIGHLAWQAALGRDTALIATVTLLVAGGTLLASSAAEIGAAMVEARRSA